MILPRLIRLSAELLNKLQETQFHKVGFNFKVLILYMIKVIGNHATTVQILKPLTHLTHSECSLA